MVTNISPDKYHLDVQVQGTRFTTDTALEITQ